MRKLLAFLLLAAPAFAQNVLTLDTLGVGAAPRDHSAAFFSSFETRYSAIVAKGGDWNLSPERAIFLGADQTGALVYMIDARGGQWMNHQLSVTGGLSGNVGADGAANIGSRGAPLNAPNIQYMIAVVADIPAPGQVGTGYFSQRTMDPTGLHLLGLSRLGDYEMAISSDCYRAGGAGVTTLAGMDALCHTGAGAWSFGAASLATGTLVTGALRQDTTGLTKPTCDVAVRFLHWTTPGALGVRDIEEVCVKDQAEVYQWKALVQW